MVSIFPPWVLKTYELVSYVEMLTILLVITLTCLFPMQTIVSQDVSLFSGTIRSNLDPLGKCSEEECLQVLERCHLIPLLGHKPTEEEPTVLDMRITQGSLSAGEKQLLALARAVLRHTSIIIMDEATSQIDSNLDDQASVVSHLTLFCILQNLADPANHT